MDEQKEQLVQSLARSIDTQIRDQGLDPNALNYRQGIALCGYIRGLTDISARQLFPEESGTPMLLFVTVYEQLLVRSAPASHVGECEMHTNIQTPLFIFAAQAGASDAEAYGNGRDIAGLAAILAKLD